jgi:hypothetical protein
MLAGLVPLLIACGKVWGWSVDRVPDQHAMQGGQDVGMLFLLMITYAIAVAVSGIAAIWSLVLDGRRAGSVTRATIAIRLVVLLAPLVLMRADHII